MSNTLLSFVSSGMPPEQESYLWLTQGGALTCDQEDHMNNVSFQEVI